MRFLWEVSDLEGNGRKKSDIYSFGAVLMIEGNNTSRYLLGYLNATGDNPCLISLDDGMVFAKHNSRQEMVDYLNNNRYYPLVTAVRHNK